MVRNKRVVILGGGTGGLIASNLLAHFGGYNITLLEKSDIHYFQPGSLWVAFQGHDPNRYQKPISALVKPGVSLVKDNVTDVNLDERKVRTESDKEYDYDYLVIALGVSYDLDLVEGFREATIKYGNSFAGIKNAKKLWENFPELKEGKLVIAAADPSYKCPPAPHKAAFLAADTLKKRGLREKVEVTLAVPFVREYPSETVAEIIKPKLNNAGIKTLTMFTAEKIDMEAKKIYSMEGDELSYDLLSIVPAQSGPEVNVHPDSAVDEDNYFKVDKHSLRILDYDDAFAIGDCNNAPTSKTGVTAHLSAEVVAHAINGYHKRFTGRTNCPI
ncbi:MAG: FAD-dependent oxidoreductase, partial [Desulfurococcales archaeon]|nr:FAD-dependent oxidoreductase [Desulfurococcales archaeon]